MASTPFFQKKFNRGEISPLLYGDTSLPWYGAALRTCQNWLPISQGSLVSRPGTKYFAHTYTDAAVKIKGFIFPDGRSYLFEFGPSNLNVYRNQALVQTLGAPWAAAALPYLKFAQVGNTVTITYGGQAGGTVVPQDLVHVDSSDTGWTIGATPLGPPSVLTAPSAPTYGVFAWSASATYNIGDRVDFVGTAVTEWVCIQDGVTGAGTTPPNPPTANTTTGEIIGNIYWQPAIDRSHPAQKTSWVVTIVAQDANGVTFESLPSPAFTQNTTVSIDRTLPISMVIYVVPSGYTFLYRKIYRGDNGVFGWLADSSGNTNPTVFVDKGVAPDITIQPPAGTNPFTLPGNPAVVSHFDQRRFFGGSANLPQAIWGSQSGNLYRFDRPVPGADSDSVFFNLVSEILQQIRAIAPMRVALVMTGQGEWTMRGSQGAGITRTNVDLKQQSEWGSSWRDPLIIGNGIIFNTAKSNMVRDLFPLYGLYTDVWDGEELSWQARHFLDGHTIVDWAYQSTPYSIIWIVRDDGLVLSVTYDKKREVNAWAQHPLGGAGAAENVCVVQEPPEDAVYFVVRRVINGVTVRYHERLSNLIKPTDFRNAICLDAAGTLDGHGNGVTTMQLSAPTGGYAVDTQATVTCSVGLFIAGHAGTAAVVFDPDGAAVFARIVAVVSATVVTVELDNTLTAAQIAAWATAATTSYGLATSVITTGVSQLDSSAMDSGLVTGTRGVAVLADGNPVTGATLVGTTLTLPAPAVVHQMGFSYNCDVQLLDAYHTQSEIRDKFKTIRLLGFHVAYSRGLWVGRDFTNLYEWQQRQVSDSYGNITPGTGYYEEPISDDWNKDGSAVVRQWEPLPVTLLGVLREMSFGGT